MYYPKGIDGSALLAKMAHNDVIIAGGLLAELKTSYFRIGHMGSVSSNDLITVLDALERALIELGHPIVSGKGIRAFQNTVFF